MTDFQVGDKVTYHGSLSEYHGILFHISELFEFQNIPCAMLQGPRLGIWIRRCRITNLKKA